MVIIIWSRAYNKYSKEQQSELVEELAEAKISSAIKIIDIHAELEKLKL